MYAQLGNIRFEGLKGFTSLEETFGVNYVQHELIKNKPRLERTGDVLDTISFSMVLHSEFTDPEADIDVLRTAMKNGEILTLILGNGKVVGNFVIPNFTKTTEFTDAVGNLISVTLSVELLESYSEDPLRDSKNSAKNSAFATTARNSNVRAVLPPVASPATALATEVARIETSGVTLNQYASATSENANTYNYYTGKIVNSLTGIEKSITKINNLLSDFEDLQSGAPNLSSALNNVYTAVQNIKGILPLTDVPKLQNLLRSLRAAISGAQLSNVNNSNQSIIRRK